MYNNLLPVFNSSIIRTVLVNGDYTATFNQSGQMFLVDGTDIAGSSMEIILPEPVYAGLYYTFLWSETSLGVVNIKTNNPNNSIEGFISAQGNGAQAVDVNDASTEDKVTFAANVSVGSFVQFVCDGHKWIVRGQIYPANVSSAAFVNSN